ncbi:flagellar motor protein MotB [Viridibacillus sp. YIM B01967]|uniref:Flagellar motor protein MotB n=1 Tax=Viridibacillus soli TaxID=2798301 RepID=A0ABS1H8P5_9BACL|nr:flagellar motor protein MotB [Viridibacillus soli]MBK3495788.1 flagellar motor protein MotB [Viridibacillus soli]
MAKKSRRRKKHEEHMDESWLIPYADILTLLLALFIVLFASSTVDAQKMQQLSTVFSSIFDAGDGVMEHSSPVDPMTPKSDNTDKTDSNAAYLEDQEALSKIKGNVDEFIAVNELEKQFATKLTDEGLLVTIRDSILFDPGKADVKNEYQNLAKELSKLLVFDPQRHVIITGYTDNVPMNNAEFASNWELSVMRAVNFLKLVVDDNSKLDPAFFSAKGYGANKFVATNDTDKGRAKNRRVEVLIQPLVKKDGTNTTETQASTESE